MAISEIEKLERRYTENPQGLTFAPLAEAYRKGGDTAKALGLLGPGLALHPDYIPASIVLGRCHLDLGDQHAAEVAFTHVLSLDGENVIALKVLADIAEHLSRLDESERWLNTLLSLDRSNDEAREQLERVRAARRQAEIATSANPDGGLVVESAAETREEPAAPGMGEVAESDAPSGEEAVPVEPLSGIVGMTESGDISPIEPSEDIVLRSSGASEFQVPNAADEWFGSEYAAPPPVPADPMITESMAELLLNQGHREEALRVYRELDGRAGSESRWKEKIAELEGPTPLPALPRDFSARATGGRSTRDFLGAMLASRPPNPVPAASTRGEGRHPGRTPESAGAPTRPAQDALSLDSVFGEEGTPSRPAVSAGGDTLGAISFDDFFSSPASGGASRPARSPDPQGDDLDQFHTWLQNLKR